MPQFTIQTSPAKAQRLHALVTEQQRAQARASDALAMLVVGDVDGDVALVSVDPATGLLVVSQPDPPDAG